MAGCIGNTVTINNVTYSSFRQACKSLKVDRSTAERRIKRGWTIDEAFGFSSRKSSDKCRGFLYIIRNSVNDKVYVGVTTQSLKKRFREHVRKSITGTTKLYKAINKYGPDKFRIKKLKTSNSRQDLRKLEVKYIKFHNCIEEGYNMVSSGCCLGDKIGNMVEYKGEMFNSLVALGKHYNLSFTAVEYRLKKGIPLEEPINRSHIKTVYKGKTYNTLVSLAKEYGLTLATVRYRLERNLPLTVERK